MKSTIIGHKFASAALKACGLAPKHPTRPVLSMVLVEMNNVPQPTISFTCSDGVTTIKASVDKDAGEERAFLVSADHLAKIARLAKGHDAVDLLVMDGYVTIEFGGNRFRLTTGEEKDYPDYPVAPAPMVEVDALLIEEVEKKVGFAASREKTRYAMNGVLFEPKGDTLRFVATDGHRLAILDRTADATKARRCVVPISAFAAFRGFEGATISLSTDENRFYAVGKNLEVSSLFVDGNFPEYEKVCQITLSHNRYLVSRSELLDALNAVSVIGSSTNAVRVEIEATQIVISAQSEASEARSTVSLAGENEQGFFGVNPRLLTEALNSSDAEEVELAVLDHKSSIFLAFGQREKHTIMPVKIAEDGEGRPNGR